MMELTTDAKNLINLLMTHGYQAYAVGGCVRDSIIGRKVGDIDITTSATPKQTEAVLDEAGIRYFETGIKHGTITALVHRVGYEITTFRSDGAYLDNRHPKEVTFVGDLSCDLARRDFTMNALAYNDAEGMIDLYGGVSDIENRVIRTVGNPDARFNEDALRIMRALRFASVLGFSVATETKDAIFKNKELLKNIAYERLFVELTKLLDGDYAQDVLLEYKEVLAVIIPELAPCFGFPQNNPWHLYDVYTHIVKTVANAPKNENLRLAALLHDIGKPACKTTDEKGTDHYYGHPQVSAELATTVLKRFKVSNEIKRRVITLIEYHDVNFSLKPAGIKKWLRRLGEEDALLLLELRLADLKAHNPEVVASEFENVQRVRERMLEIIERHEPYRIADLAIDGHDLLRLGYQGKMIQEELNQLITLVCANPASNERTWLIHRAEKDMARRDNSSE